MKPLLITAAVVLALVFVAETPRAEAGSSFGIYFGSGPVYSGGGYGYSSPYHNCYPQQPVYRSQYQWHDTSHYDYIPGGVIPHGNHYHYVPGQYQWHQTGHWDQYHRGHYHHLR